MSGSIYLDNIFFRALPDPASASWTELIPFRSTWRYNASTPPGNWFAPDFIDLTWPLGAAKFGAGSGPANIVTTSRNASRSIISAAASFSQRFPCEELLLSA